MSHLRFPFGTDPAMLDIVPEARDCDHCGGFLRVKRTKRRYVWSKAGASCLIIRQLHCSNTQCPKYNATVGSEVEHTVALPHWSVTWDVFALMGYRRFKCCWIVPQILAELRDRYGIDTSADWIERYLRIYQTMITASEADLNERAADYATVPDVILTIDGIQPDEGLETLYVVRELRRRRVWFAESLPSGSAPEVLGLVERAVAMANSLGKPVRYWMSDKRDAFVEHLAKVSPDVPHRYRPNHFLRDLAKLALKQGNHA